MAKPHHPMQTTKLGTLDPRAYARNRFRVGDRVRFSPEGHSQFPRLFIRTGVVIGFGRQSDDLVRIRRGPHGNPELYHVDMLERCDDGLPIAPTAPTGEAKP